MRLVVRGLGKQSRWVSPFEDHKDKAFSGLRVEVRELPKEEQASLMRKWNRKPADANFRDFDCMIGYARDSFDRQFVSAVGEDEFFKAVLKADDYEAKKAEGTFRDCYTDSSLWRPRRPGDPDTMCARCNRILECKECGARDAVEDIEDRLWFFVLRLADEQRTVEIKNS